MYCKYCGNQIDDDSVFCLKCGKQVEQAQKVSEATDIPENEGHSLPWYVVEEPELTPEVESETGSTGVLFSFFFPFVGIILYLYNWKRVKDPENYLLASALGFALEVFVAIFMRLFL